MECSLDGHTEFMTPHTPVPEDLGAENDSTVVKSDLSNAVRGDVSGTAVQAHTIQAVNINHAVRAETGPAGAWVPVRVDEVDLRELGVHPAREGRDGSPLPPYVERDVDTRLHQLLTKAGTSGGAVLVEGDSTAGKTRAALHALQQVLPDRPLFSPAPGQDLRILVEYLAAQGRAGAVVWLDDLHRFLGLGQQGMTENLLQVLRHHRPVVVATLRAEYADLYRGIDLDHGHGAHGWQHAHGEGESIPALLPRFALVELDRTWSQSELDRAARVGDDRLDEAVARHGEHGIAEYLAAGPELLRTWTRAKRSTARGGHPRGHSVVAAAIDLARAGLLTAPSRDILEQAHTPYMAGTAYLRPEPFGEALEWAQQPGLGASGLLLPADGDTECWRAFDYLVEAATAPIPAPVWELAVGRATGPDERLGIAINAYEAGREDLAWTVCESLARSGNPRAMNLAGYWAHQQGRDDEAEGWLRKAVKSGFTAALNNLGILLRFSQ